MTKTDRQALVNRAGKSGYPFELARRNEKTGKTYSFLIHGPSDEKMFVDFARDEFTYFEGKARQQAAAVKEEEFVDIGPVGGVDI